MEGLLLRRAFDIAEAVITEDQYHRYPINNELVEALLTESKIDTGWMQCLILVSSNTVHLSYSIIHCYEPMILMFFL